jgi:hypothetical protein
VQEVLLSSIQPMPQYETLFNLKVMANGKNSASGKSLKHLEKIFSLNVMIAPNCFPML